MARHLVNEFQPKQVLHYDYWQKKSEHHYKFCGQELDCVTSQPYLGVHISNTLSWDKHIQETIKKAQRVQNVIRRNLWSCNKEVKSTAYLSLVRPLLEYASSSWDPSLKNTSPHWKGFSVKRQGFVQVIIKGNQGQKF